MRLDRLLDLARAGPSAPRRRAAGRRCRRSRRRGPARGPARPPTPPPSPGRRRRPGRTPAPGASVPSVCSCWTAAGRWRSQATIAGLRFCFARRRASLPQAVVLPDPCSPAIRMTVGGRLANERPEPAVPMSDVSSSWTILITCWPGVRLCITSAPSARSFTAATNSLDDAEVHVGLEQREPDLAHRPVDVVLAQPALAAQAVEGGAESVGQGVEHQKKPRWSWDTERESGGTRLSPPRRRARGRSRSGRTAAGPRCPPPPRPASPGSRARGRSRARSRPWPCRRAS